MELQKTFIRHLDRPGILDTHKSKPEIKQQSTVMGQIQKSCTNHIEANGHQFHQKDRKCHHQTIRLFAKSVRRIKENEHKINFEHPKHRIDGSSTVQSRLYTQRLLFVPAHPKVSCEVNFFRPLPKRLMFQNACFEVTSFGVVKVFRKLV